MAATPLYFLPGLLADADLFEKQVERIRLERPCSVADLTRSDTIAGMAEDVLREAPAQHFALVGHSMGGYVALEVMRRAPQRVARIALLNSNARPDSPESTANRRRLMALAEKDFPAVIQTMMPNLLAPDHVANASGKITEMALGIGKEAFLRQQNAIIGRIDSRPHLAAIRCPALVVAARQDAIMPMEILEELARAIPGARLAVVEASGHVAPIEQPAEVTRLLEDFLRE